MTRLLNGDKLIKELKDTLENGKPNLVEERDILAFVAQESAVSKMLNKILLGEYDHPKEYTFTFPHKHECKAKDLEFHSIACDMGSEFDKDVCVIGLRCKVCGSIHIRSDRRK
jgi:hypothetical protein